MKKRLRFFITTLGGGGAEKVLVELLRQLDPSNYEITLQTIVGGVREADLPAHIHFRPMFHTPSERLNGLLLRVAAHFPPKLFAALFLRGKYDFEIAYLEGLPTRMMAQKHTKGQKFAYVHCDFSVHDIIAPFYNTLEERLEEYRSFDRVCFVSQDSLRGFASITGPLENACVVHNVLDVNRIRQQARQTVELIFSHNRIKLLSVGRLVEQKSFDRLLRAVIALRNTYPLELCILGEGEQREMLESIIRDNHAEDIIHLLGFRANPYPYMKQADLFVCSSLFEGYSTVITESVLLGLPVLTTDCAGMREILQDNQYGMIVENSEAALTEGLRSFAEEEPVWSAIRSHFADTPPRLAEAAREEFEALLTETPPK